MRGRATAFFGLLSSLAGGVAASCGSRTDILAAERCATPGEERPCRGECGEGTKRCEDGVFGECIVPPVEESCRNACGEGFEQCVDGRRGECVVEYRERSCENVCGVGIEACSGGKWGDCEVPPLTFSCANDCGPGSKRCENGVMGECDVPLVMRDCRSVCGEGHETCSGGSWQPCDAPQPRPPILVATVRDFKISHPDFELDEAMLSPGGGPEPGIVEFELGVTDKPVYQSITPTTRSTTGRENFDQWYRDKHVEDINWPARVDLQLEPSPEVPGFFGYHDDDFFPIDDQLYGNEGNPHNYHFTLEARTSFEYLGGETFSFTGDDDMWVFINRRLAIDLGGLHEPRSQSVELDAIAGTHGLVVGNIYPLHFFFAERHTIQSTFNIETSIADPGSCD